MAGSNYSYSSHPIMDLSGLNPQGPLAPLYKTPYDFSNRFYPRNLGSETRGHYINFYINVAEKSQYVNGNNYKLGGLALNAAGRSAINTQSFIEESAKKTIPGNTAVEKEARDLATDAANLLMTRKTRRITQAISLFMPDTMNVSYNADWQSSSLTEEGGKIAKFGQMAASAIKGLKDYIDSPDASIKTLAMNPAVAEAAASLGGDKLPSQEFMMFAGGNATNPQLEVLFRGTQMRTFQFDFLFSPFDEAEARNVREIIKTFKFHLAPEVNTAGMGRYFIPPSEFDIDFLYNGQINKNIHQIGTCVLTDVSVDYAPNGWSTFGGSQENGGGMPTQTKLTLQFMETEIVTKQRVLEDNY